MSPSTLGKKTVFAGVVLTSLALALAGCSSGTPDSVSANSAAPLHSMLPASIASSGTLNIASNVEYPPFESYAADGTTVVGIDRDIADGLQKELGVTIKFNNISFDAIIPGLASKRYDMAMSAMSDTPEREKQVDFVDYFKAGGGIMRTAANPAHVSTPADLCGVTVGIVKGTTEVDDATAMAKTCQSQGKAVPNVTIFPGQDQTILALQTGRVNIVLLDTTSGAAVAQASNGKFDMLPPYDSDNFGIVFQKGSTQLEKAVQKGLEDMSADGTYQAILKKYGQDSGMAAAFTINGAGK